MKMSRNIAISRILPLIALMLLAILAPVQLSAQAISGDLIGSVTDTTGGVVPDATVTAVNTDTNISVVLHTNGAGEYHFVNLPVGTYNVSASQSGFASKMVSGYHVLLNQTTSLTFALNVGEATTAVDVSAATVSLDTTSAQIQNTFSPEQLTELPTASQGSGVLNLALLSPGVTLAGNTGLGAGPSVGGQRVFDNNFTVEGVDNNAAQYTGNLIVVPDDAVASFTVLQNQFSAEFGHSMGGQFNQVIIDGGNRLHGKLYEYFENRTLDAEDSAFKRAGATQNPRYDNNRFGGQIGGPILKNKLFYFANFQYNPIGEAGASSASIFSPTAAGYQTLNSMAGLSKTNLAIMQKYLLPSAVATQTINVAGTAIPVGPVPNGIQPNYLNNTNLTVSVDYNATTKDSFRARYLYFKQNGVDTAAALHAFYTISPLRAHLINLSEYHTFSPTLINEARFGFNRYVKVAPAGNFSFPGLDSFPNLVFSDLAAQVGPDLSAPDGNFQSTYQAIDNLSWQIRDHSLKFGVEGRKLISPQNYILRSRGDYEYSTAGLFLQDLSPNVVGQRAVGVPTYDNSNISIYAYAQDSWRATPKLTINLGLRYEYTTVPESLRLQSLNAIASAPGLLTFNTPTDSKTQFMPRLGIAYAPNPNTAIRAGFGMGYDIYFGYVGLNSLPPELNVTENVPSLAIQSTNFLGGGGLPPGSGKLAVYPTAAAARTATTSLSPNNIVNPYAENYNLGIEHTFAKDFSADVAYVGNHGVHLHYQYFPNNVDVVTGTQNLPTFFTPQPQSVYNSLPYTLAGLETQSPRDPALAAAGFTSTILAFYPLGQSNYNSLQTSLKKQLSGGLQFVAAYTYSKTMDNSTAEFGSTVLTPRRPQDFRNTAAEQSLSDLSRKHRFTSAVVYQVPWFKSSSNWFEKNLLGNYTVAPVYTFESSEYATVQSGIDANLNGDAAGDRTVINRSGIPGTGTDAVAVTNTNIVCPVAGGVVPAVCPQNTVAYVANNPSAYYVRAHLGTLATGNRNTLPLPHVSNWDVSASKTISFRDRYKFQFTAQAYNVFNNHQYLPGSLNDVASIITTSAGTQNFLTPGTSNFNNPKMTFTSNPRTLQLVAKISF